MRMRMISWTIECEKGLVGANMKQKTQLICS